MNQDQRPPPRIFTLAAFKSAYWNIRKEPARLGHFVLLLCRLPISAIRLLAATRLDSDRRCVHVIALLEHMGDIMAAEPIARSARCTYPNRRILWVTRRPYAELVQAFSGVDRVFTVSCLTEWVLLWRAGLVSSVWDLHLNKRTCPRCELPITKDGPSIQDYYWHGTLLENQCDAAGIARLRGGPLLVPPKPAIAAVDALKLAPRFVVVHCRSNERSRDWTPAGWRELLTQINQQLALPIVEIGSVASLQHADLPVRDLCGRLSMLETAEVIRRAMLFVGVDSGPAHLANAVGTPGVVLLGRYRSFDRPQPFNGGYADSTDAELLYSAGAAATLPVATVLGAVLRRINQGARATRPAPGQSPAG